MFYENLIETEVNFYGNFLIQRALQKFRRYFKKLIIGEMFRTFSKEIMGKLQIKVLKNLRKFFKKCKIIR